MLDERLTLAASLYKPCEVGADIGTDHGMLPCHLLETGVCKRMILSDISPKALRHAEEQVTKRRLTDRATLKCAAGLDALSEPCGCVSIMGMGGETIATILQNRPERLQGARLVLSSHTEQMLVRQTLQNIGYTIVREELCKAAGRFYLFWQAEPGHQRYTEDELFYGPVLMTSHAPLLPDYLRWRITVQEQKLQGMQIAAVQDEAAMAAVRRHIAQYEKWLEDCPC